MTRSLRAAVLGSLALVACTSAELRDAEPTATPQVTGTPTVRTTAQPTPTLHRYPASTADQVRAGIATDPFANVGSRTVGDPVRVRALREGDRDLWLVPIYTQGTQGFVAVVFVNKDGSGAAGVMAGDGSGDIVVPTCSEAHARALVESKTDPVVSAQLVWMPWPRAPFLVDELHPLWRLGHQSGLTEYVSDSGRIITEGELAVYR